jgi:uncharacterized membrane protein
MSEPESLDTHEPLPRRIERHWFDRLIMLSDGVFAIAMTLLALEVRPPHAWNGEMLDLLGQVWRALFGYALSFLIVAFFWVSNRGIIARLKRVDNGYTGLTLVLLCLICLTPFTTGLVAEHGPAKAMLFYCFFVSAIGIVQAVLWSYAALWRDLVYPEVRRSERWLTLTAFLLIPLMFCFSGVVLSLGKTEWAVLPVLIVGIVVGQVRRRLTHRGH